MTQMNRLQKKKLANEKNSTPRTLNQPNKQYELDAQEDMPNLITTTDMKKSFTKIIKMKPIKK
jgi:hypothetical protein